MYRCLKQNSFIDPEGYELAPLRQADMEQIRLWRNDQMDVLRQNTEISSLQQKTYFQEVIEPTWIQAQPKLILFSFLFQNVCIGYGGLTHIDWEASRAEVSFLVDPWRTQDFTHYQRDFLHFLKLICQVAFAELHLHRLFTETFAFRSEHIKILEHFGFKLEGILKEHIFKGNQRHDSVMHGFLFKEWNHVQ